MHSPRALLTAIVRTPHFSTTVATMRTTSALFVTSATMASESMDFACSSFTVVWAYSAWISTTATAAPASPRACANPLPIPCPAPVTRATRPLSEKRSRIGFDSNT